MIGRVYFETTDGKQSLRPFEDYGLLLVSHDETPPAPRIYRVELDGADGTLDLSEWAGELKYDNRTVEIVFRDMSARHREFVQKLLGRVWRITFMDEEEWFYEGRCEGIGTQTRRHVTDLTVTFRCAPYKMRRKNTVISFNAGANQDIVLRAERKTVIPTANLAASCRVEWNGNTHEIPAGESKPAWFVITDEPGQVLKILSGTDGTFTPDDFSIVTVGHVFMGDEHGTPTVYENANWDIYWHELPAGTNVRVNEITANEAVQGVYTMFYEYNHTYYPIYSAGQSFVADALLINYLKNDEEFSLDSAVCEIGAGSGNATLTWRDGVL